MRAAVEYLQQAAQVTLLRNCAMGKHATFDLILASLNEAMLDDARWPATSALIDEACGLKGNALMVGEGPTEDKRVLYVGLYSRGQRLEDLEREYLATYHPIDECVPRVRQLQDGRVVHIADLYTAEELKTSPAYNEMFPRASQQNSKTELVPCASPWQTVRLPAAIRFILPILVGTGKVRVH